jgi:hypothetical protein
MIKTFVKPHPTSTDHAFLIVETRNGYYACTTTYDDKHPEELDYSHEEIVEIWRNERRSFRPYNWSEGVYC